MREKAKEFVIKLRRFQRIVKNDKVDFWLNGEKLITNVSFDFNYNYDNNTIDFLGVLKILDNPLSYEIDTVKNIIITKNYELKISFCNKEIIYITQNNEK